MGLFQKKAESSKHQSKCTKFFVFYATADDRGMSTKTGAFDMIGGLFGGGGSSATAEMLKNRYLPDNDLELVFVQPGEWVTSPITGTGHSIFTFQPKAVAACMQAYLTARGYEKKEVAAGLRASKEKHLESQDYTVGRLFIGVPI